VYIDRLAEVVEHHFAELTTTADGVDAAIPRTQ
jgi:hypothetical protein